MDSFRYRLISSICWVIPLCLLIYFSTIPIVGFVSVVVITAVAMMALWEYCHMVKKKATSPMTTIVISAGTLYLLATYVQIYFDRMHRATTFIVFIVFLVLFLASFNRGVNPLFNIAVSFLGFLYIVVPFSFIVSILFFFPKDSFIDGRVWILYLLVVTKSADMGGYFLGKACGKYKLAASISPGKTVEGFFGGIGFSIIASLILYFIFYYTTNSLGINWFQALWLGAFIGILGQIGDLSESLIKRDVGVKDSNKIPGFGGFLDMADSLLFTAPLVYAFIIWYMPLLHVL